MAQIAFFKAILKFCTTNKFFAKYINISQKLLQKYAPLLSSILLLFLQMFVSEKGVVG